MPAAVAVSAMMPSATAVGSGGVPAAPALLYGDRRGSVAGREVIDPLANPEMSRLCAWLAAEPSLDGADGFWPAQAVANASLGGEGLVDLATAFACGPLFNGSAWDEEVCAEAGLRPGQLPRVAVFGERVGEVLDLEGADSLGAAGREPVALAAGSVDGLCEQLVSGAASDGDVLIGLGSTLVVWLTAPGWPDDVPGLWRVPHLVAGKSMVGGASNAGGLWVDWARRLFAPGLARGSAPEPQPAPGHVPVWWPWARGERVPWHDPSLTVSLRGADISQGPESLLRAAYEASAFVVRHLVERASACGTEPKRFVVSGGGSADRQWLQALADVLGRPVLPSAVPEGAARGAAFLARMALGWEPSMDDARRWADWAAPVEPDEAWAEAVEARYRSWSESLPAEA
jgi:xylulokinase